MLDATRKDLTLGIVGTGLMGRGIAQIAAQGGVQVRLFDSRAHAAEEARSAIAEALGRLVDKGKLSSANLDATLTRITTVDNLAQLADCHIVLEAIVESLDAKRQLFHELEDVVAADCLLATNTSSLSITAIAAACRRPERVGGLHFFSPVPLMKVAEVIDGVLSASWVGEALATLVRRIGHTPVRAADTPGFIVNHAGRGYGTEALRIVGEGIADFAQVDRILRDSAGFRMGPFELFDLIGLDISYPVMESIYEQYYQEPRYRPSPIIRQRIAAGLLGRKSGRGFYRYDNGTVVAVPAPAAPQVSVPPIWISQRQPEAHAAVSALLQTLGATLDHGARPSDNALCLVLPLGEDATTSTLAEKLDPSRTIALDPLYLHGHRTLMQTPLTTPAVRDAAWSLLARDGTAVSVIHDSPGFVAQRVMAMIVNIGCDMAQQRIATPIDIDHAVTLGLGYPAGPLALGDAIGAGTVLTILEALHAFYRDPRYRPSPWLIRRARLGVSLLTPEN